MTAILKKIWGAVQTIMSAVAVTTGSLSNAVNLETLGYEAAQVTVDADFPVSPTDNLVIEVQASDDGTDFDITPLYTFEIDKDTDPNRLTFFVWDVARFRINAKRSGTTDTITVTIAVKPWRHQSDDS